MLSGGTDFAKLNVICIGACAVRSFCSLFKKTMVIRSKWHSKVIASLHDWLPAWLALEGSQLFMWAISSSCVSTVIQGPWCWAVCYIMQLVHISAGRVVCRRVPYIGWLPVGWESSVFELWKFLHLQVPCKIFLRKLPTGHWISRSNVMTQLLATLFSLPYWHGLKEILLALAILSTWIHKINK